MYHRLLSLYLLVARSWAQDASPIVDLGYAKYQGAFSSSTNITRFRGIRYAAPPIGEIQHPPIVDASILDIGQVL